MTWKDEDPWKKDFRKEDLAQTMHIFVEGEFGGPGQIGVDDVGRGIKKLLSMHSDRKHLIFEDGTQMTLRRMDGDNAKVIITKPEGGARVYLKESEYQIEIGAPIPILDIYDPPFTDPGTGLASREYLKGFILSEDYLESGKGFFIDEKFENPETGKIYLNNFVGDTPVHQRVSQTEPEMVREGWRIQSLDEFQLTYQALGGGTVRYVADERPDYFIQWDSTNGILSFPSFSLPPFPSWTIARPMGSSDAYIRPTLVEARICKWPAGSSSSSAEPVYLYSIIYLPQIGG